MTNGTVSPLAPLRYPGLAYTAACLQLPDGNDTVCETDESEVYELFQGVTTQAILAQLPSVGF